MAERNQQSDVGRDKRLPIPLPVFPPENMGPRLDPLSSELQRVNQAAAGGVHLAHTMGRMATNTEIAHSIAVSLLESPLLLAELENLHFPNEVGSESFAELVWEELGAALFERMNEWQSVRDAINGLNQCEIRRQINCNPMAAAAMRQLDAMERNVLSLRYGNAPRTTDEVGSQLWMDRTEIEGLEVASFLRITSCVEENVQKLRRLQLRIESLREVCEKGTHKSISNLGDQTRLVVWRQEAVASAAKFESSVPSLVLDGSSILWQDNFHWTPIPTAVEGFPEELERFSRFYSGSAWYLEWMSCRDYLPAPSNWGCIREDWNPAWERAKAKLLFSSRLDSKSFRIETSSFLIQAVRLAPDGTISDADKVAKRDSRISVDDGLLHRSSIAWEGLSDKQRAEIKAGTSAEGAKAKLAAADVARRDAITHLVSAVEDLAGVPISALDPTLAAELVFGLNQRLSELASVLVSDRPVRLAYDLATKTLSTSDLRDSGNVTSGIVVWPRFTVKPVEGSDIEDVKAVEPESPIRASGDSVANIPAKQLHVTQLFSRIANRIRHLRELRGWSARELERRSGISGVTIGNIEKERHEPALDTICGLAAALGVSPKELVSEEEADSLGPVQKLTKRQLALSCQQGPKHLKKVVASIAPPRGLSIRDLFPHLATGHSPSLAALSNAAFRLQVEVADLLP